MKPVDWKVMINPIISQLAEEVKPVMVRYLSIPSLHDVASRYAKIQISASTPMIKWHSVCKLNLGIRAFSRGSIYSIQNNLVGWL